MHQNRRNSPLTRWARQLTPYLASQPLILMPELGGYRSALARFRSQKETDEIRGSG